MERHQMKSGGSKDLAIRSLCLLAAAIALSTPSPSAQAQTFTVLHSFTGTANDGDYPQAAPILDLKGNLYGVALGGAFGGGMIFKVSSTGHETVLYSFKGYPDGNVPDSISFRDSAGNLFGTTYQGGANSFGMVFRLDTQGSETIVYSFCPSKPCTMGAYPGGVIRDNGNLYGITFAGGDFSCAMTGCGTVFGINRKGVQTVLHAFGGSGDGNMPNRGLVRDESGNLFGTTASGGAYGYGTVFELAATGQESVKYSFDGAANGSQPYGGLYRDAEGNLYGTTSQGGVYNYGTVFKVTTLGKHVVLHSFRGGVYGAYPYAGVITDAQGNVFGTTYQGGSDNYGTVFKIDVSSGNLTVLHSFSGEKDGAYPFGVTNDANGTLYGTTYQGGAYNYGTVFELVP
jgi:uncharacterized repeat protein (TIGR03803 family)